MREERKDFIMKRIPYFLLKEGNQYILKDLDGTDKKIEYLGSNKRGKQIKLIDEDIEFAVSDEIMNEMEFYSIG